MSVLDRPAHKGYPRTRTFSPDYEARPEQLRERQMDSRLQAELVIGPDAPHGREIRERGYQRITAPDHPADADANGVAGAQPDEETCAHCTPIGTFGVVRADHPHYLGGFVDRDGKRHDPLMHAVDCPTHDDPEPLERVAAAGDHNPRFSSTFTRHRRFARCPECQHATVGSFLPYAINHAASCSVPAGGYLRG